MADISVVILNYNGEKHLRQFLSLVVVYSHGAEIVIADNCSTDGSISYIQSNFPSIKLITFDQNYGYTGGYNRAMVLIDTEFAILLNSDIEVTPNWIVPVLQTMKNDEQIAACQPKILSYHDKQKFEYAGAAGGFIDVMGYPYCRGRVFDTLETDFGQYDDSIEIFWATGACLFVRTQDFLVAGGFDEDFFAHMEEIDLCWRFHLMGKKVCYEPKSAIYHVGGGTLSKSNPRKTYFNLRNNLSMLLKNERKRDLIWKLPIKAWLDTLTAFKLWKDNSFTHFLAVFQAYWSFVMLVNVNLNKRRFVKSISNHNPIKRHPFLLPYSYFIKGKKTFSKIKNRIPNLTL